MAVIGAGLLGCFTARALTALNIRVTVFEAREDVCTGISKANTGIIYTGSDTKPGTLKTQLCVRANRDFDRLCRELDVRFSRCGSLMVSFGPRADHVLQKKFNQGQANGVPGLELLCSEAVYAMESNLAPGVTSALYAPGTGTVDPWELCIAAYENAKDNGADFRLSEEVTDIERNSNGYLLKTGAGCYSARLVVNCAGLRSDTVRELVEKPRLRIFPTAADYLVLDDAVSGFVKHIIFHEPEEKGKGLTLVPTVDGNLLVGPTARSRDSAPDWATSREGLAELKKLCAQVVPVLPMDQIICSFAALRPDPYAVREGVNGHWVREERSISNFTVLEENGLISLLGIKTPGLTCCAELGNHVAELASRFLGNPGLNPNFNPNRRAIRRVHGLSEAERDALIRRSPEYGEIVCRCRDVTLGEILEAIRRGAVTLDGVKRRTCSGMGRCQGARCMQVILEQLAQAQELTPWQITKDGASSKILTEGKTHGDGIL